MRVTGGLGELHGNVDSRCVASDGRVVALADGDGFRAAADPQQLHARRGGGGPAGPVGGAPKTPPASVLLKKAAGITAGSKTPNKEKVGKVTRKQVLDIVKLKLKDLNSTSDEAGFRVVAGTARSMGIEVVE